MPTAKSILGLEGIVVGCANAIFLKDVASVGVLHRQLAVSVYVSHDIQLAALGTYVTELEYRAMAQTLFHLQTIAIKIGRAEVLVDGICCKLAGAAVWIRGYVECDAR